MRHVKLVILLVLIAVSSCSTGPSKEAILYQENIMKEKTDNAKRFVDIFLKEFWHKPLETFIKPNQRGKHQTILTVFNSTVNVENLYNPDSNYGITRFSRCNKLTEPPPLAADLSLTSGYPQRLDANFVFAMKSWEIIESKRVPNGRDCSGSLFSHSCTDLVVESEGCVLDKRELSPGAEYMHVPMIEASAIRDMLLDRGVPLAFCHSPKYDTRWSDSEGIATHQTVECAIDMGQGAVCRPDNCHMPVASVFISTYRGMLTEFRFNDLNIEFMDHSRSLAEIYYQRFQDPTYVSQVSDFYNRLVRWSDNRYQAQLGKNMANERLWAEEERQREAQRAQAREEALRSAVNKAASSLQNHHNEFATPALNTNVNTPVVRQDTSEATKNNSTNPTSNNNIGHAVDKYLPQGESSSKISNAAKFWCTKEGGSFNASTGQCTNPTKENCLKTGRRWMGDRCDSKINRVSFPGRACSDVSGENCNTGETIYYNNQTGQYDQGDSKSANKAGATSTGTSKPSESGINDDCCYDIGQSDKTYGDALDKAKAKAERVCRRKGENLKPINLFHEQESSPGFKFRSRLTYKCGIESQ